MKLSFESNDKVQDIGSATEADITKMIENLTSFSTPYVILEKENGDYIQGVIGDKGFVVEARFYGNDGAFKHFVIGYKNMSKVWNTLNNKVGPIRVLGHEILGQADVKDLFMFFLQSGDISNSYNKRNITKLFVNRDQRG